MRARQLIAALCSLQVLGCTAQDTAAEFVQERLYAMGTWVDITFASPSDSATTTALAETEAMLRVFERDYYPWTAGALADLNTAIADGRSVALAPELAALLQRARSLSVASDGYFDPGVGALVELWGFNSTFVDRPEPPSDTAIDSTLRAGGGIVALALDGTRASSPLRGLKIDLGGIAKGAAVARILAILESHGIGDALVNAGGDLAVIGHAAGGRAWRIGIREPRAPGTLGVIELGENEAAFTSGDYERYYERAGQRMHHLLDPMTGRPASHTQALTVVSDDPVLADAAATALFVAGPGNWRAVAERLGIRLALRVDAAGTIEMTPAMEARVEPTAMKHDMIAGSLEE